VNYTYTLSATIDNDSIVPTGDDAVTLAHFDDSVEITVNGQGGTTDTDDLVIRAIDDTPDAEDHTPAATPPEDTPIDIDVTADITAGSDGVDLTNSGGSDTVYVSTGPTKGNVIYNDDGTFTYTPTPGETGTDSFVYTVVDGDGDTDTALVTINLADDSVPVLTTDDQLVDETGGLDSVNGILSVAATDVPVTIALAAAGATWNAGANTLYSNTNNADSDWQLVDNLDGTYTFTQLNVMTHSGGEDAAIVLNFTATATDSDGSTDIENFTVTVYDDGPTVTEYTSTIVNGLGASLAGVLDFDHGLDGLGGLTLAGPTVTLPGGGSHTLTSGGAPLQYITQDLDGDGLEELIGYVDTGGVAGYNAGEEVFTLAPNTDGVSPGEYDLILSASNVLDLPADTIEISFSGIQASGPISTLVVSPELTVNSVDPGTNVNASGFIGIDNNVMNDSGPNGAESIEYVFNTSINDLQLDIKQVGGNGDDSISWEAFLGNASVDTGNLTIPGAGGLTGPIHAGGEYDSIIFTVTNGDFKVGGITYTDLGDPQDITMQFGYTATEGDGDNVSGTIDITVTDSGVNSTLNPLDNAHTDTTDVS